MTCYSRQQPTQQNSSSCSRQTWTPRSIWYSEDHFITILVAFLFFRHRTLCQDLPSMSNPRHEQASHSYHSFNPCDTLYEGLPRHHAYAQSSRVSIYHCSKRRPFRSCRRTETQTSNRTHRFSIYFRGTHLSLWSYFRNRYRQWTRSQRCNRRTITMSRNSPDPHFALKFSSQWSC